MMTLKTAVGNILRKRGYHVFKSDYLDKANLSLHLRNLLTTQKVDCVFDVGANKGQYYSFLRDAVGFTGLVISFEPVPRLYESLQKQAAADPKWIVHGCALGRTNGTAPFNIMKGDQLSSFRSPSTLSTDRFHDSNTIVAVEHVAVRTLDDVYDDALAQYGFSRPYLKIDAQGFDLEVAHGGVKRLAEFVGVQCEASLLPLYDGAPAFDETLAFLKARGLAPSAFFPVATDQKLRLIDCDCVFVNPSKIWEAPVLQY
jgi:FkbM family methyltransferase